MLYIVTKDTLGTFVLSTFLSIVVSIMPVKICDNIAPGVGSFVVNYRLPAFCLCSLMQTPLDRSF